MKTGSKTEVQSVMKPTTKKLVIMRHVLEGKTVEARTQFSSFFLPLYYLNKFVYETNDLIAVPKNNIVTHGCNLKNKKTGEIIEIKNFNREDPFLVSIVEQEMEATIVGGVYWKVVEIPIDAKYEVVGTEVLNESVLFVDETLSTRPYTVIQKKDYDRQNFGWPQDILEEYIKKFLHGTKLLYNPKKDGMPRTCLQSMNNQGKLVSTKVIQRNSIGLAGICNANMHSYVNVLQLHEPQNATIHDIFPGFEIAIPKK